MVPEIRQERVFVLKIYDSNHESLEYARLPIFKNFIARKFTCFSKRHFTSKSTCLVANRRYLRYILVFSESHEGFSDENYQAANVIDNPLCSMLSQIEPKSLGYGPGLLA